MRSHGGCSDNPTARLFQAIYKKLLIHNEVAITSSGTNCIPLEKISILTCSSVEKINLTTSQKNISLENEYNEEIDEIDEFDIECQMFLSPFGQKVIEYISGFVVFSLSKKIKCDDCLKGLFGPCDDKSLIYHKTKGFLKYASESVIVLCRVCEKILRQGLDDSKKLSKMYTTDYIITRAFRNLAGKQLFPNIEMHDTDVLMNHHIQLAKSVMKKYIDTRISYLVPKSDPKKCIRHVYSKLIHFKNQ